MSSPYVTRSQWGARPPSSSGNSLTGTGKGAAIHWEGPEMGSRPHSECDNLMRSIQNYHMDSQDWSDIAYNLACCAHGYIFEGRGKGKGAGANGTSDANHNYPAICALVGEHDDQPVELDNAIADAVAMLRSWGVGSAIKGHRDFVSTACPGDEIYSKVKSGRYNSTEDEDMANSDEILSKLDYHIEVESGRYGVYSGRYSDVVARLNRVEAALAELTGESVSTAGAPPVEVADPADEVTEP